MVKKTNILVACGYHPSHLVPPTSCDHIIVPDSVKLVEMGLADLTRHQDNLIYIEQKISLHLARSPICENNKNQNDYIDFLKSILSNNKNKISSIGIHLTGPRNVGIGKLGFSSHFTYAEENEISAIRFIQKLKKEISVPVWIENANFYSTSAFEVIKNWECIRRILAVTEANLILDLTHSFIECQNLGLNTEFIFGLVPWDRLVEIHVSGYTKGSDGALHDGHSETVKEEIWQLLRFVMENFITSDEVIVNIEHTDLSWKDRKEKYLKDFEILAELEFSASNKPNFNNKIIDYAISNLNRLLSLRRPEIQQVIEKHGYLQKEILRTWIQRFIKGDQRLVFSKNEVPEVEHKNTITFIDGFEEYIRKNLI